MDLSNEGLTSILPLVDVLLLSPDLEELVLSGNQLNSQNLELLFKILLYHHKLKALDISGNPCMSSEATSALNQLLCRNSGLVRLCYKGAVPKCHEADIKLQVGAPALWWCVAGACMVFVGVVRGVCFFWKCFGKFWKFLEMFWKFLLEVFLKRFGKFPKIMSNSVVCCPFGDWYVVCAGGRQPQESLVLTRGPLMPGRLMIAVPAMLRGSALQETSMMNVVSSSCDWVTERAVRDTAVPLDGRRILAACAP